MEDHATEKTLERDLHRRKEREHQGVMPSKTEDQPEGSGPFSRTEIKDRTSQGRLESPPFTAFNPESLKWGRAGVEERGYQDDWGEKVRSQSGSGPEVFHASPRLGDSRFPHGESGPPPQLEGWQNGEETAKQQRKIGKKEKSIR